MTETEESIENIEKMINELQKYRTNNLPKDFKDELDVAIDFWENELRNKRNKK